MPKISRTKLLEYQETEFSEELDLSRLARYCEIDEDGTKLKTQKSKIKILKKESKVKS